MNQNKDSDKYLVGRALIFFRENCYEPYLDETCPYREEISPNVFDCGFNVSI